MSDLPTNLDDKLADLPDDLAASLVDVPDGGESCECGLALPDVAPLCEGVVHHCDCGRVWANGDGFESLVMGANDLHVDTKPKSGMVLAIIPPTHGWQHVADTNPAEWAQHIDSLVEDYRRRNTRHTRT